MTKKDKKDNIEKLIRSFLCAQIENDSEGQEAIGRFKYWISNHPDQDEIRRVLNEVWDEERTIQDSFTKEQKREIFDRMGIKFDVAETKKSLPFRKLMMRVAAVVLPIMIISGGYFLIEREQIGRVAQAPENFRYEHQRAGWAVPNGENKIETLVDSSKVWVNAGSTLSVEISDAERMVALSGEALFEVTKDSQRPFIVVMDELRITVLGTKFNVEAYPDQENIIVTLAEGRVSLTTETEQQYILEPNNQLIYNRLTKLADIIPLEDTATPLAWTTGKIVCQMKTMKEIFQTFERKYGIEVIVENPQAYNKHRVTATFGSEDSPETVMDALGLIGNFRYEKKDGKYMIISGVIQ